MNRIALLLILLTLASSCATNKKQESPALYLELPDEFRLVYSSSWGGFTELQLEDGQLIQRTYDLKWKNGIGKNELTRVEHFRPSHSQWQAYWAAVDALQIWSWQARYDGKGINDGGTWKLHLSYRGKSVQTSGENAGPVLGKPAITDVGWGAWSEELENATNLLLK